MCVPACTIELAESASRRGLLKRLCMAAAAATVAPAAAPAGEIAAASYRRVVDLTHTLGPGFPMPWPEPFRMEAVSRLGKDKWNAYRWHIQEHSGTHLDAPLHCSDGPSADRIPATDLVGPLVVVDLRDRASADADAALSPDDLTAWERRHGPIPDGAVVAMFSGWESRVGDARRFFGLDERGGYHFPGFHAEAVLWLREHRKVKGIATDTLSLDPGDSKALPAHHDWLGGGRWGLENVANLGQVPAAGATIVVGGPNIAGCTGGPSRVLALV